MLVWTPPTVSGIGWTGTVAVETNGTPIRSKVFALQLAHCAIWPSPTAGFTVARKLSERCSVSCHGTRKLNETPGVARSAALTNIGVRLSEAGELSGFSIAI